ncbi:MAG: IS630 family transposase [Nitrososphaerota archaeon]|nr:IS630 family transposase [Nitrososphaerota archaeon]
MQTALEVDKLVFIDECGVNLAMTRLYGWGERCARVVDYIPDARFERTSILSAVRLSGVEAPVSFKGTLNGELFALYVKYVLAPTLNAGDVVLLDNLSSHKVAGVLDPVFERGAFVWFLPAYSPDLNPIELLWSKVKSVLRKLKARTHEELQKALKTAFDTITPIDIKNWFKHNGYHC